MAITINTDSEFTEKCACTSNTSGIWINVTEERLRRDERRFLEILYAKEIESAKVWARRKKRFIEFFSRRRMSHVVSKQTTS